MPLYFAYGSNMHRARLERRVGRVIDHGWARLPEHRHGFTAVGGDGTGKGNIEPRERLSVHGVLYELSAEQLDVLGGYEGGYDRVELAALASIADAAVRAASFRFIEPVFGLLPTDDYLEHYRLGMAEHDLPEAYIDEVLAQARAVVGGADS